jgi:hypothetical protein
MSEVPEGRGALESRMALTVGGSIWLALAVTRRPAAEGA